MNGSNLLNASPPDPRRGRGGAPAGRRTIWNFAGLTLALLVGSCLATWADEFSQESRYSVRLFSVGSLSIDTRVGDIDISGWDEPRVEIDAEKVVRARNRTSAQPLFDQIRVVLEGQDKLVQLRTIY